MEGHQSPAASEVCQGTTWSEAVKKSDTDVASVTDVHSFFGGRTGEGSPASRGRDGAWQQVIVESLDRNEAMVSSLVAGQRALARSLEAVQQQLLELSGRLGSGSSAELSVHPLASASTAGSLSLPLHRTEASNMMRAHTEAVLHGEPRQSPSPTFARQGSTRSGKLEPKPRGFLEQPAPESWSDIRSTADFESIVNQPAALQMVAGVSHSMAPELYGQRWLLNPQSRARVIHDAVSIVLLLCDLSVLPVLWAWDVQDTDFLQAFFTLTWLFWFVDIGMGFSTGIYVGGALVMDRAIIARHYLRTWFVPDLAISAVDTFVFITVRQWDSSDQTSARLLRISKVTRLARLVRLIRVVRISERVDWLIFHPPMDLLFGTLKPLAILVMVNHLMACLWFGVAQHAPSDTGFSWLDTRVLSEEGNTYRQERPIFQYLTAIHWAITQMTPGSMQIFPMNSGERAINVLCLLFGMLAFSTLISAISSKMVQSRSAKRDNTMKINKLRAFLRRKKVNPKLAMSCLQAAGESLSHRNCKPTSYKELAAVPLLPTSMQLALKCELVRRHLRHPLIQCWEQIHAEGVRELCHEATDFESFAAGDLLFRKFAEANSMYYLTTGQMLYSSEGPAEHGSPLEPGTCISEAALFAAFDHLGEAVASGACEVLAVHGDAFGRIAMRQPLFGAVVHEYGTAFVARMKALVSSEFADELSDLSVRSLSMSHILPFISCESRTIVAAATLRRARSGRQRRRFDIERIHGEVVDGKGMIMLDEKGEPVRVVVVQAIALQNSERETLFELGRVSQSGELTLNVRLPGTKPRTGEAESDTVKRLMEDMLLPFADAVTFSSSASAVQEVSQWSSRMQMQTTYLRNVRQATLQQLDGSTTLESMNINLPAVMPVPRNSTLSHDSSKRRSRRLRTRSTSITGPSMLGLFAGSASSPGCPLEVLVLAGADGDVALFCWLSSFQQDVFTSEFGEDWLRKSFSSFRVPPKVAAAARDVHRLAGLITL